MTLQDAQFRCGSTGWFGGGMHCGRYLVRQLQPQSKCIIEYNLSQSNNQALGNFEIK